MVTSYSALEFNPVDEVVLVDGTHIFRLHSNIRQETTVMPGAEGEAEEVTQWVCDEVTLVADYTKSYVEENFDDVWVQAQSADTPLNERVSDLETMVDELSGLIG